MGINGTLCINEIKTAGAQLKQWASRLKWAFLPFSFVTVGNRFGLLNIQTPLRFEGARV